MNLVLFDGPEWSQLWPLTLTRPVAACRVGALTIAEKWSKYLSTSASFHTSAYLQEIYPYHSEKLNLFINGSILPDSNLAQLIKNLKPGQQVSHNNRLVALISNDLPSSLDVSNLISNDQTIELSSINKLEYPEDIIALNSSEIFKDYKLLGKEQESQTLENSNFHRGEHLFISSGVKIYNSILNTENGPIYIDKDVEIQENSVIRGPVYVGPQARINVGAKVYEGTSIGKYGRIGGEVKRSVIFDYSNKSHDGFIGDSVVGSWCNFGADSNVSNLKNTYGKVKLHHIKSARPRQTELQFCGTIMGDHSMCAINTSFNTGTVVGPFTNVYGGDAGPYIPPFSWGLSGQAYQVKKAIEVAKIAMSRRNVIMNKGYEKMILHLSNLSF